jgi:hypothetical protein
MDMDKVVEIASKSISGKSGGEEARRVKEAFAIYEYFSEDKTNQEMADELGLGRSTIAGRRRSWWTVPEKLRSMADIESIIYARQSLRGGANTDADKVKDSYKKVAEKYVESVDDPSAEELGELLGLKESANIYRVGKWLDSETRSKLYTGESETEEREQAKLNGGNQETTGVGQIVEDTSSIEEDAEDAGKRNDKYIATTTYPSEIINDLLSDLVPDSATVVGVDLDADNKEVVIRHEQ